MPFMLYDLSSAPGADTSTFVRTVNVAGRRGPMARFAAGANPARQVPFGWHATAEDLIALLGGAGTPQAIVIDLKPNVAGNVSLYRLLGVWGHSSASWTPLALLLQVLYADHQDADPPSFKRSFIDRGANHALVGEFLYVQGGVGGGTWNWGMVGRVNGALLWRDAFRFLTAGLAGRMG